LLQEVKAEHPLCTLVIPELPPVYGAVMLAMDQLSIPVTGAMIEHFKREGGNRK
jgi:hypothetical protein